MNEPVKDKKSPEQTVQDPAGPTPAAGPERKGGGAGRKPAFRAANLFTALIFLLVIIGALGYAALIFRDKDARVKIAADYIENELGKAERLFNPAPKPSEAPARDIKNDGFEDAPPVPQNPTAAVEPSQLSAASGEPAATDGRDAQGSLAKENPAVPATESPEQPQSGVASTAATPTESPKPPESPTTVGATEAPAATPAKDDLSLTDLVNALDGRVEALSQEIKTLRERADQFRKEAPVAGGSSNEAATVVIAFALQKELDAGRPYADEIAALTRTGADPVVLGVLTTMAESGAPTGARLHDIFKPLAKKIRAEEPTDEQDLASHLIHGASKLVRVRPTGTEQPETLDGNLAKIDAALTHDNFAAAAAAFAALPEWARSQAGEFAQTLDKRLALAKASEDLLHGAIAALGGVKK